MLASGLTVDVTRLPVRTLSEVVEALPQLRAIKKIDLIDAITFPYLSDIQRRVKVIQLRIEADPSLLGRLIVRPPEKEE